jgi:hypothetical protein
MKTLQDVAKQYKKSAAQAIYPGVDSPLAKFTGKRSIKNFKQSTAFKTGNLLTQFVRANADDTTISREIVNGYEFTLNVAPQGAEYGSDVHFGTLVMGARPFAEIAAVDTKFRDALNELILQEIGTMLQNEVDVISQNFQRAGFQIS